METRSEFLKAILGTTPVGAFAGWCVIGLICAFVLILIHASTRDVNSTSSPVGFSWKYLLSKQALRMVANLLCVPIVIALASKHVAADWMLAFSIGIGFGVDGLAMIMQKFGVLTTNKFAERVATKIEQTNAEKAQS